MSEVLPENIDATYPDRTPGDALHQHHHDVIHNRLNNPTGGTGSSDRSTHTGVQAQSTVTNLVADLAAKAADGGTITDFNTATKAGFYGASNTTANAPTAGQWWYLTVTTYSSGATYQQATLMTDAGAAPTYDRQKSSAGEWSAWVEVANSLTALDARYGLLATPIRFSADIPTVGTTGSDRAGRDRTITEARMRVGTGPVGSSLVAQVQHYNGASWSTVTTLTTTAGSTTEAVATGLSQAQSIGHLLRLNVTSIGVTPAADVVVDVMTN